MELLDYSTERPPLTRSYNENARCKLWVPIHISIKLSIWFVGNLSVGWICVIAYIQVVLLLWVIAFSPICRCFCSYRKCFLVLSVTILS